MGYGLLLILHLLAAIAFVGTVFFEVVMLSGIRRHVPRAAMLQLERALGTRATKIMPWVLLVLYGAGLGLASRYHTVLAQPLSSGFATMLTIKVLLALSVFGHFACAMVWRRRGTLNGKRSDRLHVSVFCHVLLIVVLAKAMFYFG